MLKLSLVSIFDRIILLLRLDCVFQIDESSASDWSHSASLKLAGKKISTLSDIDGNVLTVQQSLSFTTAPISRRLSLILDLDQG